MSGSIYRSRTLILSKGMVKGVSFIMHVHDKRYKVRFG